MDQTNKTDANAQITKQVADLVNVDRLVSNTLNLIADMDIKGAYSKPVAEIQDWLTSFKTTLQTQRQALEAVLPKPEAKEPEVLKAEVVGA